MPAPKTAHKTKQKAAASAARKKPRAKKRPSGYNDEVTRETLAALNKLVPDEEFENYEVIADPAW